jgi:hypothetical protein
LLAAGFISISRSQPAKRLSMNGRLFHAFLGALAATSLAWQGAPEVRSENYWAHINDCIRDSPDVVLVCEYAQEFKEENANHWQLVTSCAVVQPEKGSLKKGQKITVRRMIEKNRKDEPVPQPELGNLRYLFYDAANGWIDTGSGSPFDEETEKRVKADVAQQRKDKASQ